MREISWYGLRTSLDEIIADYGSDLFILKLFAFLIADSGSVYGNDIIGVKALTAFTHRRNGVLVALKERAALKRT